MCSFTITNTETEGAYSRTTYNLSLTNIDKLINKDVFFVGQESYGEMVLTCPDAMGVYRDEVFEKVWVVNHSCDLFVYNKKDVLDLTGYTAYFVLEYTKT